MTDSCSCLFKKQKEISLFRHTIIRHAHLNPDIILSLIHLAQEGEVFLPLTRARVSFNVHPILSSEMKVQKLMMTGASHSQTSELYMGVTYSP